MKYSILVLLVVGLYALQCNVAYGLRAPDQAPPPFVPVTPTFDSTAFQEMILVPPVAVVVPTVVEIPITDMRTAQTNFRVVENTTGQIVPNFWRTVSMTVPLKLSAVVDDYGPLPKLVDGNSLTSEMFPLPESGAGIIQVHLQTAQPVAMSALTFALQKNVSLPQTISIETETPAGKVQKVLADSSVRTNTVVFPIVTTNNLKVTLTYTQPLRISEINIDEEKKTTIETAGLRFLAQPNASYTVFLNPDRDVSSVVGESGDLRSNVGVVRLAPGIPLVNGQYRPNDSDGDGIMETIDNCPFVANPTQIDINSNSVGDECDDYDRDGVMNSVDNCPDLPNQNQLDEDADGIGDVCDDIESRLTEKYAWILWVGLALGFITLGTLFAIVLRRDPNVEV